MNNDHNSYNLFCNPLEYPWQALFSPFQYPAQPLYNNCIIWVFTCKKWQKEGKERIFRDVTAIKIIEEHWKHRIKLVKGHRTIWEETHNNMCIKLRHNTKPTIEYTLHLSYKFFQI